MPHIASFTTVVDDIRRSLDFYRRLGVDVPASSESQGFVSVPIGPDTRLEFKYAAPEPGDRDRLSIGVRCDDPAEVDALYWSLACADATVVLEPVDAPWGARRCRLLDPDGNTVELFAPLP